MIADMSGKEAGEVGGKRRNELKYELGIEGHPEDRYERARKTGEGKWETTDVGRNADGVLEWMARVDRKSNTAKRGIYVSITIVTFSIPCHRHSYMEA